MKGVDSVFDEIFTYVNSNRILNLEWDGGEENTRLLCLNPYWNGGEENVLLHTID